MLFILMDFVRSLLLSEAFGFADEKQSWIYYRFSFSLGSNASQYGHAIDIHGNIFEKKNENRLNKIHTPLAVGVDAVHSYYWPS